MRLLMTKDTFALPPLQFSKVFLHHLIISYLLMRKHIWQVFVIFKFDCTAWHFTALLFCLLARLTRREDIGEKIGGEMMERLILRSLCVVLLMSVCEAMKPILSTQHDILSIYFNKTETIYSSSYTTYHIEADLYKGNGNFLFLQQTYLWATNGKKTSIEASGFKATPFGFKQLNSTHVYVADTNNYCIKLVNREDKTNKVVGGSCGTRGNVDGKVARFHYPWSIEVDGRNPQQLLISDNNIHAIRSLDIESGYVSTVVKTGLYYPTGMAWYNGRLLVCNQHYISEVSWSDNETVTSTILTGLRNSGGYQEGPFSIAKFYNPYELMQLQDGLFIVADVSSSRLRLLNMLAKTVSPVCFGTDKECTTGTTLSGPYSSVKYGDAIYVISSSQIRKLTGYQCLMSNITVYVYPDQERVNVPLDSDNSASWPPGEYHFHKKLGSGSCSFVVNVVVSPIVRTAVFRSEYDVTCTTLDNPIGRAFLQSILAHRKTELQTICGTECEMSTRQDPWYSCKDDLLTVTWPTMAVYPVDVNQVPDTYSSSIFKKLKSSQVYKSEIVILSHDPPLVKPKVNADGETIQMVLTSACADQSKKYDEKYDKCA